MTAKTQQDGQQIELRFWQHSAIFLFACAVIVSRRPDAVLNAQFWNEDGHVFFAEANNFGWWAALFRTYAGYFHGLPRLGASLALLVPLPLAPLVLNLIAIGVQALPANILLSSRSSAWGSLRNRAILAAIYLALPNCWEIDANITNSQWLLALNAFLLLVASRPDTAGGRCFDLVILSLCGLSGPFCIFLFPIAFFLAWRHRGRWRWATAALLLATSVLQMWGLFGGGLAVRPHVALGVSPAMLARVLAGQLYLGTLIGSNPLASLPGLGPLIAFSAIAVAGTVFVIFCLLRLSWEMKLFLIFSGLIMAAGLLAPTPGPMVGTKFWWVALTHGAGERYWFFPDLALAWSILFCFQSRIHTLKTASAFLLCILCFGIALRWEHPAFPNAHFADYARSFASAPPGTIVTIPECTPGWNLQLVKHSSK